jgi:hypothetical protein
VEEYLNLWRSTGTVPEPAYATSLVLSGDTIDKDTTERWKAIKNLTARLASKGFDASHVPIGLKSIIEGDVLVLSTYPIRPEDLETKIPKLEKVAVRVGKSIQVSYSSYPWIYNTAWKNTFRMHMRRIGFLTSGSFYVPLEQVTSKNHMKDSFRIAAEVVDGLPSLWIDPGSKVMVPLEYEKAKLATPDETIAVRVLMDWRQAFVIGVYPQNVAQYKEFDLKTLWESRGVPVNNGDAIYKVKFTEESRPYAYPQGCVFKEYESGKKDSIIPKYPPAQKVQLVESLLKKIGAVKFLGKTFSFGLIPTDARALTASYIQFESGKDFIVTLKKQGRQFPVNVFGIKDAFAAGAEPYTGKKSGKYYVVCPLSVKNEIDTALRQIELTYQQLNMGSISRAAQVKFVAGNSQSDYIEAFNLTVSEIINAIQDGSEESVIVFVVLPDVSWENALYYAAKGTFFNPSLVIEGIKPIQIQCVEEATVGKIPLSEAISSNLAPQIYLKLYGRHAAVWLCDKAADSHVYPFNSGITAYACFDVSRRKKLKSQVSVFTAVTDGYGRFIAYDTVPAGGENLTPLAFAKLIENISRICKQYSDIFSAREPQLKFNLQRIVLYKDGQVDRREAEMMKDVFEKGIPEEGIQPLAQHYNGRRDLPQSLAIDILGVNKSSIKRLFIRSGSTWMNPKRGLCIIERGSKSALLVSSQAQKKQGVEFSTVKPLQIEHIHHFTINSSLQSPKIEDLAREYYHLTFLDWVSFYQRSKFALPQRITQKTGEYLSHFVNVPKGVTLI